MIGKIKNNGWYYIFFICIFWLTKKQKRRKGLIKKIRLIDTHLNRMNENVAATESFKNPEQSWYINDNNKHKHLN